MNTIAFLIGYICILVPGLILINRHHRLNMKAIDEAHRDRIWLINLCADASGPYLGRLVVDTSFSEHIKARRRGEEWEWLKLYPESIQNLVAADAAPATRLGEGKVPPFTRPEAS